MPHPTRLAPPYGKSWIRRCLPPHLPPHHLPRLCLVADSDDPSRLPVYPVVENVFSSSWCTDTRTQMLKSLYSVIHHKITGIQVWATFHNLLNQLSISITGFLTKERLTVILTIFKYFFKADIILWNH